MSRFHRRLIRAKNRHRNTEASVTPIRIHKRLRAPPCIWIIEWTRTEDGMATDVVRA